MTESDAEFKAKFMELVNNTKAEAGKTSSLMRIEKRERIIRCLQNPVSEPNQRFRSRVKERKYKLLQQDGEVFLGVPDESSGEVVYRRAACVEEFFDIIHAAHVDNGHIGVVHTFSAIRGVYALLPRYLVSHYIRMCPVCAHTFRQPKKSKLNQSRNESSTDPASTSTAIMSVIQPGAVEEGQENGVEEQETSLKDETVVGEAEGHMDTSEGQSEPDSSVVEGLNTSSTATATVTISETLPSDVQMVFNCHICDMSFVKKLLYQRHIRNHREHNPRIPFVAPYRPPYRPPEKRIVKQERRSFTTVVRGRQILIDGDMGVEATQALMLAACRTDLTVLGVTCVNGAVSVDRACSNALCVLGVCGREDVQVFCGAERPLINKKTRSLTELPGPSWPKVMDNSQVKREHAVSAMIRLISENPGKITLVCLGPLTNLALAMRLDSNVMRKLKDVFLLGGNIEGRGDSSVCAEQNFHHDPEAAYAVLEEMPNITLLPYEVCDRHKLTGDFFDSWVHLGTTKSEFVRGMGDENWLREHQQNGYAPFCAYLMAVVADRTIALEKKTLYATVELNGAFSRGMMVVDWAKRLGLESNVEVVQSLDLGKIQSLLIGTVEDLEAMEVYTVM